MRRQFTDHQCFNWRTMGSLSFTQPGSEWLISYCNHGMKSSIKILQPWNGKQYEWVFKTRQGNQGTVKWIMQLVLYEGRDKDKSRNMVPSSSFNIMSSHLMWKMEFIHNLLNCLSCFMFMKARSLLDFLLNEYLSNKPHCSMYAFHFPTAVTAGLLLKWKWKASNISEIFLSGDASVY